MIKKLFIKTTLISLTLFSLILCLQYGKRSVFNYICTKIKDQTGYELHIKEIDFTHFFSIKLNNIKIKDNHETFLSIKKAEITLDLLSFLKNSPTISSLSLTDVIIHPNNSKDSNSEMNYKDLLNIFKNHAAFPFSISHYTINALNYEKNMNALNIHGECLNSTETLFFTIIATINDKEIYFISDTYASTTNSVITYNDYKSQITFDLDEDIYDLSGSFAFHKKESLLGKSNFQINLQEKKIHFDKLNLYENPISFFGEITQENNVWIGHFISHEDQEILNSVGLNLKGKWIFDCKYIQDIDLFTSVLKGKNVYYNHASIEKIDCQTEISHLFGDIKAKTSLNLENISNHENLYLDELHLNGEFDLTSTNHPIKIYLRNEFAELRSNGSFSKEEIFVKEINGVFFGVPFYTSNSIKIHLKDKIEIHPFTLENEVQELLKFQFLNDSISAYFNIRNIPLFYFNTLYSQNLTGSFCLKGQLEGPLQNLNGILNIDLMNFTYDKNLLDIPSIDARLACELANSQLKVEGNLNNFPLFLSGTIPLKILKDETILDLDDREEIFLNLSSEGNIAPLFEWMAIPDLIVSGQGKALITLSGKKDNFKISGKGTLKQGYMESFALGTELNQLEASVTIDNEKITLTTFEGTDSEKNGKLKGRGYIEISKLKGFPCSFNFNMHNFQALNMDYAKGIFEGNIHVFGTKERLNIEGNLHNIRSEYSIVNKIEEIAETVDVIYINQNPQEPMPTLVSDNKIPEIPISVDIKIAIPDVFDINSGDLRSRWGGHIQLLGDWEKISMKGEIQLSKGYYILNGQEYQIKQGNITFGLDSEKKATIYAVGSRDINDYQIDIILQGRLTNPNIILRSNPTLPQQEILSLILFGKSPSEISTFEDEQLEQSLSSLLKDASSPGILSKIQKSIGIDRIDINRLENGDKEELSIKVGKNITKNIFIGVKVGDEPTRFSLEAKLKNDFKVQIDAGESSKGSADKAAGQVSFFWKHDY